MGPSRAWVLPTRTTAEISPRYPLTLTSIPQTLEEDPQHRQGLQGRLGLDLNPYVLAPCFRPRLALLSPTICAALTQLEAIVPGQISDEKVRKG